MASKRSIPNNVITEVLRIVDCFNQTKLKGEGSTYIPRMKGRYLYLDRDDGAMGGPGPICRLEYTGDMDEWQFEIYKYSSERYDPEECFFPGIEYVDGTVKGALEAGMKAYPSDFF